MDKELVWLGCPILGLFWQIGGYKWKLVRRIGYPLIIMLSGLLFSVFSWQLCVASLLCYVVTTLPLTLIGDDIPSCWINWVWVWVYGAILASPVLLLGGNPWTLLVPLLLVGSSVTLSNLSLTQRLLPHKFVEFVIGASCFYPFALIWQGS